MAEKRMILSFQAKGADLFLLFLKNFFLTIVTFGIYSFWAKINVQKFLNRGTRIGDEPMDFHGTGDEKFFGFLKGMGIVIVIALLLMGVSAAARFFLGETVSAIVAVLLYAAVIFISIPLLLIGKKRYFFSRSSWRGVRFLFSGKWKKLARIILKGGLLSVITFGLYIPWFMFSFNKFMIEHSHFGTERFVFSGDENEYIKTVFLGIILSMCTLGIYSFWYKASLERYNWNNTSIQGRKMSCSLTGGMLFKMTLVNILIFVLTLGFGFAWILVRMYRVWFSTIAVEGVIDFDEIKAAFDSKASALADGFSDAADALDSIADLLG